MADQATGTKGSSMGSLGTGLGSAVGSLMHGDTKRLMNGVLVGGGSFMRTLTRVGRILFHQITGFLFIVMAIGIGERTYHQYHPFRAGTIEPHKFYVPLFFAVLFAYFGLSSFWRARK